jgi:hypothetical protein
VTQAATDAQIHALVDLVGNVIAEMSNIQYTNFLYRIIGRKLRNNTVTIFFLGDRELRCIPTSVEYAEYQKQFADIVKDLDPGWLISQCIRALRIVYDDDDAHLYVGREFLTTIPRVELETGTA